MAWQSEPFRHYYRTCVGTVGSSNSYVSYLNHIDRESGGLDSFIQREGAEAAIDWVDRQPLSRFRTARHASHCRSAIRSYAAFLKRPQGDLAGPSPSKVPITAPDVDVLKALLREAKLLGARYYQATGKALGIAGEVAELEAAEKLNLQLLPARNPGHDAIRLVDGELWRVQIKGRIVDSAQRYLGPCPAIKYGNLFDSVVLVLLDRNTLEAIEIWEAPEQAIIKRLQMPGSKARNERNAMAISQFKSIATKVWPA